MATEPQKTVVINGQHYDARTGLPVATPKKPTAKPVSRRVGSDIKPVAGHQARPAIQPVAKPATVKKPARAPRVASSTVHATTQRSQTLQRRIARKHSAVAPKPAPKPQKPTVAATAKTQSGRSMDIARSSRISKFAPKPVVSPQKPARPQPQRVPADKPATKHPLVSRASQRSLEYTYRFKRAVQPLHKALTPAKQPAVTASSKDVKNTAIAQALAAKTPKAKPVKPARTGFFARHRRAVTVVAICLALLTGGAFVTISNLPLLSVSLAASQAGIKAGYPSYTPDGYSLQQPVTYDEGEVTLTFLANGGNGGYTLKQERSSWDSTAVLDNVVKKEAGDNYTTTQDSGLTIYTYEGNAAWVNRGILYTIDNTSTLSNEQVNAIATSL